MLDSVVLPLGAVFILFSTLLLVLQSDRRDIVLERFHLKRRRDSGSTTPPRSFSPEKKRTQNVSIPDYSAVFPPSRRSNLAVSSLESTPVQAAAASRMHWTTRILSIETPFLEASNDTYMPCEFSVAEIKALGDFPDYSVLSGVPLPEPYREFDINKALPRPYRPFRWAYHQTMCKSNCLSLYKDTKQLESPCKDGTRLVDRARKHIRRPNEATLAVVSPAW